ncbi:MAG: hypothetical protein COZ28_00065 [Candidatus Moranbacteria bacterium CG_4_10_14_3_um_filter_44_15]|nr:MAG: hypothetical protein COS72_03305 [Candidatus Moranbacteria bacterium CG06_land_8_20_14_3_00_43_56]PIV83708.1 MAG: hypothetical protein COW51_03150 [Candidatus Moranbacteria bacterium CG17_big_fil_post_rev_8_21_14_2_50_44_12]PIW92999.1 MAG: hypothetical protein COZ87_03710 [Candidatus Moranbacteria bacterium CG_4_8_14_3_um_filter_43_15]PIX91233.1 MAG: hypothetical protein COZ28_00065 [Candidatus Moranbacteria bacterium CG_4_10_14_3_um_filter_44_15]PJA85712.1 MAG: hypothetical protein CO1
MKIVILTTHILSGALVGAEIKNPFYVAVISIIVHFLLDLFPHGDYLNKKSRLKDFWKVAIDLVIGFSLVAVIIFIRGGTSSNGLSIGNVAIGIIFSLLPDFTTFLYRYLNMEFLKPVKNFHESLHCYENGVPEREFRLKNNLWDILISLISLIILISLH